MAIREKVKRFFGLFLNYFSPAPRPSGLTHHANPIVTFFEIRGTLPHLLLHLLLVLRELLVLRYKMIRLHPPTA